MEAAYANRLKTHPLSPIIPQNYTINIHSKMEPDQSTDFHNPTKLDNKYIIKDGCFLYEYPEDLSNL